MSEGWSRRGAFVVVHRCQAGGMADGRRIWNLILLPSAIPPAWHRSAIRRLIPRRAWWARGRRSTQTQPYCVWLGAGSWRYSSRTLAELVGLDRLAALLGVDAEEAGGVEAEDLVLDRGGQLGVAVLVDQVGADLEAAHPGDLALRAAPPDRVGPPEDVVGAGDLDHLAEHVHADDRGVHRGHVERPAELEVDVLDPGVPLEDAEDVADPGDLLRVVGLGVDDLGRRSPGATQELGKPRKPEW